MRVLLALILVLGAAVGVSAAAPTEAQVDAVARELRCVVCQNQSVADSPSEMARQMREVIRERLAAGESPEQVKAYFASRYGEWVLLSPPTRGFPLLAWVLPLGALVGGLVGALLVLRRWSRRGGMTDEAEVDEEALAAVRRELERRAS
ncbi:MAG: cytochrome c-type biogenesis protein CcmH [Candidatus Rokubacteria bacterium]|nr:cytochrome c-type biogenesis protein CcmH [Candidatus Rokubacteria bacterium]